MLVKIKTLLTKEKIKDGIKKLKEKGFFSIFGGSILVKCISFCSVLFLPRIISSTDQYGILSIVDNFNSYLVLVSGLGLSTSILRFCVLKETHEEKKAVFNFCLYWGLLINGIFIIIALIGISVIDFKIKGLEPYLIFGIGIPSLLYVFDCISMFLRAEMRNREYARLSVVYTLLYAGLQVGLAFLFKIYGALAGRYFALLITICVGVLIAKKRTELFNVKSAKLLVSEKKELVYFAIGGLMGNAFSIIMPMNEQMVVTVLLSSETQTAFYKAASIIPTNLQFIANAVVIFVYPYFTKHTNDLQWVKKKTGQTLAAIAGIIVPITAVLVVLSPWIIKIIFGESYMPALNLMRVMMLAFFINSVFRMPVGSILGAIGKVKFNAINAGCTAIIHLLLDYIFISKYGINGSAIALAIAYTLAGIANIVYLNYLSSKEMNT